jgi:hypothetical protein
MGSKVHGIDAALSTVEHYTTDRQRHIGTLVRYAEGCQYVGRPSWHDDSIPLVERGPNIVDPIVSLAVESYVDLVLGEGRFPSISAKPEEGKPAAFDARLVLADEPAEVIDSGVLAIVEQVDLVTDAQQGLADALVSSASCVVVCIRAGRLTLEHLSARDTLAKLAADGSVVEVKVEYPFVQVEKSAEGKVAKAMLYRRIIDANTDTVWHAEAKKDAEPNWRQQSRVEHGMSFCPAVWYAHDKRGRHGQGRAIHELLLDELDELNRSWSQRARSALYSGDPQIVETGVDADHNPSEPGRRGQTMRAYPHESPEAKRAHEQWQIGGGQRASGVRKKGPGVVWRYPPSQYPIKVDMLTLPSGALDGIADNKTDLRSLVADALGYVQISADTLRGSSSMFQGISGRTLEWMYRRQLDRCDKMRTSFGRGWIVPVVSMCLRVVMVHASSDAALYIAGAREMSATLSKLALPVKAHPSDTEPAELQWFGPSLHLTWGPYFPPTEADQATVSGQVRDDHAAGLITLRTAVERLAPFYDIQDVDAYVEQLEAEKRDRMGSLHAAMAAMGDDEEDDDDDEADGPPVNDAAPDA